MHDFTWTRKVRSSEDPSERPQPVRGALYHRDAIPWRGHTVASRKARREILERSSGIAFAHARSPLQAVVVLRHPRVTSRTSGLTYMRDSSGEVAVIVHL